MRKATVADLDSVLIEPNVDVAFPVFVITSTGVVRDVLQFVNDDGPGEP